MQKKTNQKVNALAQTLHKKMKFSIKDFFSKCAQIRKGVLKLCRKFTGEHPCQSHPPPCRREKMSGFFF